MLCGGGGGGGWGGGGGGWGVDLSNSRSSSEDQFTRLCCLAFMFQSQVDFF